MIAAINVSFIRRFREYDKDDQRAGSARASMNDEEQRRRDNLLSKAGEMGFASNLLMMSKAKGNRV